MKTLSRTLAALASTLFAFAATVSRPVQAQTPITFTFTGEITSVDDTHKWLQNTYVVGAPLSGTFTYFSGARPGIVFGYPETETHVYFVSDLHPAGFNLNANGRQVQSNPFSSSTVYVTNNGADPNYNAAGDTFVVQPSVKFPDFFTDPSTEPGFEDYYAYPFAQLRFYDPTGTALSSNALPLTAPDISLFSTRIGRIGFFDGNGEIEDSAQAFFRINTLQVVPAQAVPEPGAYALWVGGAMAGICLLRCRRRRGPI